MIYQIKIKGKLDESWSDWLGDVQITAAVGEDGVWITTCLACLPDPTALFGILDHIRDLNLQLVSMMEIEN